MNCPQTLPPLGFQVKQTRYKVLDYFLTVRDNIRVAVSYDKPIKGMTTNIKNLKELKLEKLVDIEYNALTDYLDKKDYKNYLGESIDQSEDLYEDESGNIYFLYSWKTEYECNDSTGYNSVAETNNQQYEEILKIEERKELVRKEYQDNKSYYDKE